MRRRVFWMFLVCLAAMGCDPKRRAEPAARAGGDAGLLQYEAVTASALVFDPPVIADDEPLELSRAGREPFAVLGYDGPVEERFYIRFEDSQIGHGSGGGRFGRGGGNFDRYERRAVTERVGVRYR
jgi:hypothetical protein